MPFSQGVSLYLFEGESVYIYPDNMKGRASLFLWRLWDLVFILIGAIVSVLIMIGLKTIFPLAITATIAFVSIRFDDQCILDYLKSAFRFCVSTQQYFLWRLGDE